MLKPKRKITKQEIKKDPLLEFLSETQQRFKERKKILYQVAFGLVALVAVVYFLNVNRVNSALEGEAMLGTALISQDMGDVENTKFQLKSLVDEYEGTDAGIEGKYYLGKLSFEDGELDVAAEYLNEYVKKGDNDILMTSAYKLLAAMALLKDDKDGAEDHLRKGSKYAENTVYHDEMVLLLANQLYENGKIDKAENIVDDILQQEEILFTTKRAAEELKGRIGS